MSGWYRSACFRVNNLCCFLVYILLSILSFSCVPFYIRVLNTEVPLLFT